ncbi:MAG: hypothetical protein C0483_09075 [Pirellula sp.]|nr:hypothetical protein [Pirellula sp.]
MSYVATYRRLCLVACLSACAILAMGDAARAAEPTPVAEVKHDGPVDFQKEVLPILKKNCTACHNASKKEGSLVLEGPASILKGGDSGPAAEKGKGAESLLVTRAAAADDEQMPPADNKVGAKRLTSQELGLLKLWIDQGATGDAALAAAIEWQPLPAGVQPIFTVALSPDGQFAACGRANQIFIYHLPTGRLLGRLTDPSLLKSGLYTKPGVADLDLIQSLAFSPDGRTLASGGFRTIKLWKRADAAPHPFFGGKLVGAPQALAISADGRLAAAAVGNDVQLWNNVENKPGAKLAGHKGAVRAVAFAADGARLTSVSADKTVRVWSTADGKQLAQADAPVELAALAVVGDGSQLVAGGADNKLRLFSFKVGDAKLAAVRDWAAPGKRITAIAGVPSAPAEVVSGDEQGNIVVWNTADGKQLRAMQRTGGEVTALAVRADGQRIAAVGPDKSLRIWNTADGKQLAEQKGDIRKARDVAAIERTLGLAKSDVTFEKAAVAEAEKTAKAEADGVKKAEEAKTAADKTLKEKTDAATKAVAEKQKADAEVGTVTAAKTKADEAKAAADKAVADAVAAEAAPTKALADAKAAAAKDAKNKALADAKTAAEKAVADAAAKTKKLREAATIANQAATAAAQKVGPATAAVQKLAKPTEDAEKAQKEAASAAQSAVRAITSAQAAAKKSAAAVPIAQSRLKAAETAQKDLEGRLAAVQKQAGDAQAVLRAVAFSTDGLTIAVGGDDKLVQTYSSDNGAPIETYAGQSGAIAAVAFSGGKLVAASADGAVTARPLDVEWTLQRTIGDPASQTLVDRVTSLDFSPDGKLLASGGGEPSRSGELKIWNPADGTLVREVPDAHSDVVLGVRFSPDGKLIASCGADKFLKTFQTADGKFVRGYEGHTHHVLAAAWSADGRILASAGADSVLKLWDVATGEQKRTVTGFTKEVTSLAFAGTGTNVVATSGDKSVRLVSGDNGSTTKTYPGATDFVYGCAVSTDGKTIVAGGHDGVLRIWNADTAAETRNFPTPADATNPQAGK